MRGRISLPPPWGEGGPATKGGEEDARHPLIALVFAILVFALAFSPARAAPRPAGEAVIGLQLEPPGLDPTAGAAAAIKDVTFPTIYEGLTRLGPGGAVGPGLALRWSHSADGLVWRFDLRPGVRFQDGSAFDALAVKAALERAGGPASTNAQRPRFAVIAQVTALGPLQVELKLRRPYALLPQVLGWGDAAIPCPRATATLAMRPCGTGPFRMVRWRRGYSVELERNSDYWGARPKLQRLTFRFIADPAAALAELDAGDVDAFPAFPAPESVARLQRDPRFAVRIGPTEAETILALNNARAPLNDLRVRRALSYAVDRRAVIDGAMFGFGAPIGSHYPPQDPGYVDLTGRYPHDIARARALLAEAGVPHPVLTLKLPPPPYARRAGEILAAQLTAAGAHVRIEALEWAPWLDQVFGRHDFDMTVVAHVEPADYDIYGRPDYYFGYKGARVRAALGKLDAATDPVVRAALLGEVQRAIADDAVNVFLFEYPAIGVWNTRMAGLWAPTPVQAFDYAAATASGPVAGGRGGPDGTARATAWVLGGALVLLAALALRRADPMDLARRFGQLTLTLLAASLVVFVLVQVAPGDPARAMMGIEADPGALRALRAELGLDAPAWLRYVHWLAGMARGDLGLSYTYRTGVSGLIAERLAVSAPLAAYALALTVFGALGAALAGAARPGGVVDRIVGGMTILGLAAPNFWLGMLLVMVFASVLRWAPAGGFPGWEAGLGQGLAALTLPAVALAVPQAAVLARVLRAELAAQLQAPHILTARAKGAAPMRLLLAHALPNAAPAALAVLGLQAAFLLAGGAVVETVFSLPGLGRLLFQAMASRDLIVVQGVVMTVVATVILAAFAADLAAAALDPRVLRARA